MKETKSKIAAFIEGLSMESSTEGVESALLPTKMCYGGAAKNGGNCTNESYDKCNKSENGGSCQNHVNFCNNSTNRDDCKDTGLTEKPSGPLQ